MPFNVAVARTGEDIILICEASARTHPDPIEELYTYRGELDFTFDNYTGTYGFCGDHFMSRAGVALDCFERGLARCAMVEDYGWCGWRWDTHYDMFEQNYHFELLFQGLNYLMEELHTRRAPAACHEVTWWFCQKWVVIQSSYIGAKITGR